MSSCSFVARDNSEKSLCVRVTAFIFIYLLMYREVNLDNPITNDSNTIVFSPKSLQTLVARCNTVWKWIGTAF
jgi:hypothetical protein